MGEGATLTRAFRCVLMDPEWEKAREDQAIARIHRCGQKQNIQAYRLICSDGADGVIVKRHAGVQDLNEEAQEVQRGELQKSLKPVVYQDEDDASTDQLGSEIDELGSEMDESLRSNSPFPAFRPLPPFTR